MGPWRSTDLALSSISQITRSQIIERARSWLRPPIAYSQNAFYRNEYGTYRTDCSGYVSMAWALPGVPVNRHGGLDTVGLAAVSSLIVETDLLAGDVLIRAEGTRLTRHVVIFEKWLDERGDAYWGFEQVGGVGTVHRTIDFPYDNSAPWYRAARYLGVVNVDADEHPG